MNLITGVTQQSLSQQEKYPQQRPPKQMNLITGLT